MSKVRDLRRLREQRVWSQAELAERARVSRLTIHNLENGGEARPATIRKIAAALLVEPEELVLVED